MKLKLAIIGKPNVGKSTLFNKLCGRRLAITHDLPGVTRDVKSYPAKIGKFEFELFDTAGLDMGKEALTKMATNASLNAAKAADIVLFVADARGDINDDDRKFADMVRKLDKQIVLILNKCEGKLNIDHKQLYRLGFGEPIMMSAEHKIGFGELEDKLKSFIKPAKDALSSEEESELAPVKDDSIKMSLIGRPNVGKSTLFNKLIGFERSIVSDVSGTTRDSITHFIEYKDTKIELIDTAGLRRKSRVNETIEELSTFESITSLRRSNVVLMVLDATIALEKQDLTILKLAIAEGKSIVIVVNKSDLINDLKLYIADLREFIDEHLFEIKGVEVVFISAKNDKKFNSIFASVTKTFEKWKKQVSTAKLNEWLKLATERHIPPLSSNGRRIRLKYATQTATRPPTFALFGNMVQDLPESYVRYLMNDLRESFDMHGTPLRFKLKKGDNPYSKKK